MQAKLGAKIRGLRRREHLSQARLAEHLGISASYLNLIEHNKRPLPASLLIELTRLFNVDLEFFARDEEARLTADLSEAFADPLFESLDVRMAEVRELAANAPSLGRAVVRLYEAYREASDSVGTLASKIAEGEANSPVRQAAVPSEEVTELIQLAKNHFPELEEGAEKLARDANLEGEELYSQLSRHLLRRHKVRVRVCAWDEMKNVLRHYNRDRSELLLSELLPTRSRKFQLAHQLALLEYREAIDGYLSDSVLTSEESRSLGRIALANYFAGAVLMPYEKIYRAARGERYDVDVLGRRFGVSFEQVCHRLTTLRREGAEGVPFHMIRIDAAGNISKRFSASGIRFARFSGACPRWNVFQAAMTPGLIRTQVGRMPDGAVYFCIARSIQRDSARYHDPQPVMAIGLGCRAEHARELVYSDGIDLEHLDSAQPIGVSCRICERMDCEQRAHPSLLQRLRVDENVRGLTSYVSEGGSVTGWGR